MIYPLPFYFLLTAFFVQMLLAFEVTFSVENAYKKLGFVNPGVTCILPGLWGSVSLQSDCVTLLQVPLSTQETFWLRSG